MAISVKNIPPSRPSPTGEGAKNLSPLGENERGYKSKRNIIKSVNELMKDNIAIGFAELH